MNSKHSTFTLSALLLGLALLGSGCDADVEPEGETIMFDGEEVAAELALDPSSIFFVDLRDDLSYEFDQRETSIDWSHFIVQCPSMDQPMPMEAYATIMDIDLERPRWLLAPEERFRFAIGTFAEEQEDMVCIQSCDANGEDCVWFCAFP